MVELRSGNQEFLCVFVRVHEPKVGPYENRFQLFHFTGEGWGMAPVSPPTGSAISGQFMTIVFGTVVEVCYTFFLLLLLLLCFYGTSQYLETGFEVVLFYSTLSARNRYWELRNDFKFLLIFWFSCFHRLWPSNCSFPEDPLSWYHLRYEHRLAKGENGTGVTHGWGFVW